MKIAFACDHAAFEIKSSVIAFVQKKGHTVVDFGCTGSQSCDYPDHAVPAAKAVADGNADRGVLICGTGIGMSIVAKLLLAIVRVLKSAEAPLPEGTTELSQLRGSDQMPSPFRVHVGVVTVL